MPRRKYARKNERNETALTTQLMRISLRMDDHIYNNKPIAASQAARFLQEIATLKLQCPPTNARALQVIEKLTRLMKNILTEDCQPGNSSYSLDSFQINSQFVGSASPVYSLPDEDRNEDIYEQSNTDFNTCISDDETMHRQIVISSRQNDTATDFAGSTYPVALPDALTDENKIKDIHGQEFDMHNLNTTCIPREIPHKGICIPQGPTLKEQGYTTITKANNTYPKNTSNNGQVIDITNDSDDEANEIVATNEQSASIEHVNSALSIMVIHDKIGNQMKHADVDDNCSQSILDNYDKDSENTANMNDEVIQKELYKEFGNVRVINKVNNYFQKQTPLAIMPSQDILAHAKSSDSHSTKLDLNVNDNPVRQSTIMAENNKIGMGMKVWNDKLKPKKRKSRKNDKLTQNDVHKCLQNVSTKTSKNYNKENRTKTVKRAKKQKRVQIYNENVENDLSWVENLRYVREVSPSEYDPALTILQDNFWDTFELPGTWNDLDFEF